MRRRRGAPGIARKPAPDSLAARLASAPPRTFGGRPCDTCSHPACDVLHAFFREAIDLAATGIRTSARQVVEHWQAYCREHGTAIVRAGTAEKHMRDHQPELWGAYRQRR